MDTINWISFVYMDNELKLTTQIDEKKRVHDLVRNERKVLKNKFSK